MKVDIGVRSTGLADLATEVRGREEAGYDGLWTAETAHDPFLPHMVIAEHTERVAMGTGIAVAFGRSPMTVANTAHDLQVLSEGRFLLGLGSQIKPHIERRFSMPWSSPAKRMREYVSALRAIWAAWNDGEKLDFRGDFYQHTLMTPFFTPAPSPWGPPKVYLAAVGELMTRTAGEVCDGLQPHAFTTARYLEEVTLPIVHEGLARSGRKPADFSISFGGFVVTGRTEEEMAEAARGTRQQIAFYASTPAYRPVLELHGWGELQTELNRLSKGSDPQRWQKMGELVDDEVLDAFAVTAEPDALGAAVLERWGRWVDRFSFYAPYRHSDDMFAPAIDVLRKA
ncbi:LLM class F420-dependent oxidoreductase [Pseudonocardia lacus]|uniref:LLM class F420-dependent oxidoreductase n=1 Tax=Pseudonocardia lacus TaxID=2835865 RepID=UPI001BDD7E12|nr:LLM class F420-dependent oxidoreductase [Pseudonocardia lacus]